MDNDEQNSFSVPDHDEIQEEIKISNQEESLNQEEFSKQNEGKIHQISFKKIKSKLLKKYPKFKIDFKIIKV